jgi:DNA-directed RNA polymerase specialized sigma24 family protein
MIRDGRPKGSSSPAEGGNLLAILIDIKKAYTALDVEHQSILVWRYHQSMTLAQVAQLLECAVSTADRRITFALRALQDKLGGQSPWR